MCDNNLLGPGDFEDDTPVDVVFDICAECGEPIFEGDDYYELDARVHEECLKDFLEDSLRIAG